MIGKIKLDLGIKEYELGNGILKINPSDPNLFKRFADFVEDLPKMQAEFSRKEDEKDLSESKKGEEVIKIMCEFDRKIKMQLNAVFGLGNDFDKLLYGQNLMAIGENGERLVVNLISALEPIISEGAKQQAKYAAKEAVARAKVDREKRSSMVVLNSDVGSASNS